MGIFEAIFGKRVPKIDIGKRFERIERVGQGTMSEFWRARDRQTGRLVGLKILDREQTEKLEARFTGMPRPKEGEIAVSLSHPNVVKTLEHGVTTDGLQFLVMEFIEGTLLSTLIRKNDPIIHEHRMPLFLQLGEAVSYVHEKNWIHRDICPRNVIVTPEVQVKLIDFGLMVPNTEVFRRPGNRTGTANYMAPELLRRKPTDQRIDVFSYAVTCYETCSAKMPWETSKKQEGRMQYANQAATDLQEVAPDVFPEISSVIMKGLEVDANSRWQSARKMTEAFRKVADELGIRIDTESNESNMR